MGRRHVPVALLLLLPSCASSPRAPAPASPECPDALPALTAFFIAWNDSNPDARANALETCCSPGARFLDPSGITEGTAALATSIAGFRARYPQATVEFGTPTQHHCAMRVAWTTVLEGGGKPVRGVDFVDLDPQGRFTRVVSFNDPPGPSPR